MPKNSGFYTDNINNCPDNVKFKGKEKFPSKILVWVAISEKYIPKSLTRMSGSLSTNQEI